MKNKIIGFKNILFKIFVFIYQILPFKRYLCLGIRKIKFLNRVFYKRLIFKGPFKIKLTENKIFYMFHYGGRIENETFWRALFISWESDTGWIWQQLSKYSDVVFDIGANTGIYSLVTKSINPEALVYAFEPSSHTYYKLKKNNALNEFKIKCEKIALSNISGEQVFFDVPYEHQSSASLSAEMLKNNDKYNGEIVEYKVETMTLSKYIESHSIEKIDLIKLDVEMYELEVIEGLGDYLLKFKPIIIIEVLNITVANKLNQLIDLNCFKLFHLQNNQKSKQLSTFKVCPGGWNYLLFHKDLDDKIKLHTTYIMKNKLKLI